MKRGKTLKEKNERASTEKRRHRNRQSKRKRDQEIGMVKKG